MIAFRRSMCQIDGNIFDYGNGIILSLQEV